MHLGEAAIIRSRSLIFETCRDTGAAVATPVSPAAGSTNVTMHVVVIPPGRTWGPPDGPREENVALVFRGAGKGQVGGETRSVVAADAMYAATGAELALTAEQEPLTAYVWRTPLLAGRASAPHAARFSTLWDTTTQLVGFAGTGQVAPADRPATMNFVFWPGTGSGQMCLHCGIQQPGETFNVHMHTDSEEAFISFEGAGQMYLRDRWIDVDPGDILYAAPTILHGTRNPDTGPTARRFVTCGGPAPFDPFLYAAAGVSAEVR